MPQSACQLRLGSFLAALQKIGLAKGNGLALYERYWESVENLPCPREAWDCICAQEEARKSRGTVRLSDTESDPSWQLIYDQCSTKEWVLGLSHVLSRDLAAINWSSQSTSRAAKKSFPFLSIPVRTRGCLALLCIRLADSITVNIVRADDDAKDEARMELAHQLDRTTVLSSLATALGGIAATLKQLQLESQDPAQQDAAMSLAGFAQALLTLFTSIAAIWPGALIAGEHNPVLPTVEPASELAAAVFEKLAPVAAVDPQSAAAAAAIAAAVNSYRGAQSGSSGGSRTLPSMARSATAAALVVADLLSFRVSMEGDPSGATIQHESSADLAAKRRVMTSKALQQVLLTHLGYATQQLHSDMRGKTAVSRSALLQYITQSSGGSSQPQQQRPSLADVEPHHKLLLNELIGVTSLPNVKQEDTRAPDVGLDSAIHNIFALMYQIKALQKDAVAAGPVSSSSNASRASAAARRRGPAAGSSAGGGQYTYFAMGDVMPVDLDVPLLLVLVELMQLVPSVRMAEPVLQCFQIVHDLLTQSIAHAAAQHGASAGGLELTLTTFTQPLLNPVLQHLTNAVVHAVRVQQRAAQDGEGEIYDDCVYTLNVFAGIIVKTMNIADVDQLSAMLCSAPAATSLVLEAGLRTQAHAAKMKQPGAMPATSHATLLSTSSDKPPERLLIYAYKAALAVVHLDAAAAKAAAAAGAAPQVLSLLLSCCKYAAGTVTSDVRNCLEALSVAGLAVVAVVNVLEGSAGTSTGRSNSSSRDAAAAAARCLHMMADMLSIMLEHTDKLANAKTRVGIQHSSTEHIEQLLKWLDSGILWFGQQLQAGQPGTLALPGDTGGTVQQHLFGQQQKLQQCLQEMQSKFSRNISSEDEQPYVSAVKAVIDPEWLKQLKEWSGELCANLVPEGLLWCNNPGCVNMEKFSEAQLAKKRCSACKLAHHCCQACQVAQWKQHKLVCKRVRASQQ